VPSIDTDAINITVECTGDESDDLTGWLNSNGGAVASDLCSDISWSNNYTGSLSELCGETGDVTVIFVATDECGNASTTSAIFTIEDTIDPIISCPQEIYLECGDPVNGAVIETWLLTASGLDDCGDVVLTNDYLSIQIIIEDNTNPVLGALPQDITIECNDPNYSDIYDQWIFENGQGLATDECGEITWDVVAGDPILGCGANENIIHLFTVTDECGNTTTATATVLTEDTTPPVINLPTDLVVECDGAGNSAARTAWLESISGMDDCCLSVVLLVTI